MVYYKYYCKIISLLVIIFQINNCYNIIKYLWMNILIIKYVSGRPCECIWMTLNTLNLSVSVRSNFTHPILLNALSGISKYTPRISNTLMGFLNTLKGLAKYTHTHIKIHSWIWQNTLLFWSKYSPIYLNTPWSVSKYTYYECICVY